MNAQGQNIESGKIEVNKSEVGHEIQSRAKTNVLTVGDKCCSCSKWQEYKYPSLHAMAYLHKWEQLAFITILQHHVHEYYWFERLQQIYDNIIFPFLLDQIQYDGISKPPSVWKKQAGCPKKKWFRK